MTIRSLLLLLVSVTVLQAVGPKRALVVEDHTGAWCGWCVRGNQAAEELHALYGDQFIPLGFHNDDSMALAVQDTLRRKFGITGYPSGLIDRETFSYDNASSTSVDPDNWADACTQLKDQTSNVGVDLHWSIDANGILSGTVSTTFFAALNTQYAINVIILEDSVSGKGKGWDQTNYLSGRKGYESHPYYYLAGSITSYYHMNVVRAVIGGSSGDTTNFPRINKNGDAHDHAFQIDLKSLPIQHRSNIWVAALVVEHAAPYRVVNAASFGKRPTPKSSYWKVATAAQSRYRNAMRGDSVVFDVSIENTNDSAVTAITSLDAANSSTPSDWSVRIEPETQEIEAHGLSTARVIVKLGSSVGYAGLKIVNTIRPFANILSLPTSVKLGVLSDGVKYAIAKFDLDDGLDLNPLLESYTKLDNYPKATAVIDCNDSTLAYYDFNSFDVVILPESYATRTSLLFDVPMINMVQARSTSFRPTIITSPMDLWFGADNYGSIAPKQFKTLFEETLGFKGARRTWGPWLWNSQTRQYGQVGVQSFAEQDVAKGYDFMLNEIDSVHTVQDGWLDEIVILDTARVHRILNLYGPFISDDSSTGAVWTKLKNTALIYQGFGFEAIRDEPTRRALLANYLAFLQSITSVEPGNLNSAHLQLGPNPAESYTTLHYTQVHPVATISLHDARGSLVWQRAVNTPGTTQLPLNVESLTSGRYTILFHDGDVYSVCSLIVKN